MLRKTGSRERVYLKGVSHGKPLEPRRVRGHGASRSLGTGASHSGLTRARRKSSTWPALSALVNGHAALSPDMALRIEKAFGPKMDTLLRMQTAYEIVETRDREGDIKVKRYVVKARPAPTLSR